MNIQTVANASVANAEMNSLGIPINGDKEAVAESFEAVFASQLVKVMRESLSDGLFGDEQSGVLGGMFDLHMGQALAEGGGLGIKQLVMQHWSQSSSSQAEESR